MCQFESLRRRVAAERTGSPRESGKWGRRARGAGGERSRPERAGQRPPPSRSARVRAVGLVGGRMELNSLLILLEAAEYLERRDREAEHGYASVLPFDGDFARKKTKAAGLVRKAPNNRSSHNELEKHRKSRVPSQGRKEAPGWVTRPAPGRLALDVAFPGRHAVLGLRDFPLPVLGASGPP
ncbi:hypothetical protein J1605_009175 [Eschrichtius robustus]|uniref:Max dimerization protein 1 n=1 Tax=Eschrichtius robustus TaxID=9764 RepID=A0AB34GXU5_ESCRO|nr:hypothetical protein J1605_009175 [Eschrichtius robustus]